MDKSGRDSGWRLSAGNYGINGLKTGICLRMAIDSDANHGCALRDSISCNRTSGIVLLTLLLSHFFASHCAGATYESDGSAASVQSLHRRVTNGDTITLPPGTFTWSTSVTISKAIKLEGAGSGRIIGNTKSSVTVGTGIQTFTTTRSYLPITVGQTLRIAKMPGRPRSGQPARDTYMQGTVTSYSGTTLMMNITSKGGSGTYQFWWIGTQPKTTVSNAHDNGRRGNPGAVPMLKIVQSLSGSAEITGIQFTQSKSAASSLVGVYNSVGFSSPKLLIHDCWFQIGNGGKGLAIYSNSNQLLVWNCSFEDTYELSGGEAFQVKAPGRNVMDASWATKSTMGMADTKGVSNLYIEDCDFHACNQVCDADDKSRVVIRHCLWDNSQFANHGADTSNFGMRHVELYDNEFVFDAFPADCATEVPLQHAVWLRGGTGIITDNVFPQITSACAGTKGNIVFSVLNTRRKSGAYCCWKSYPAPHQVGQGYGPGAVFHPFTASCGRGHYDYYIYSEPVYISNNSGTGGNAVSLNEDPTDQCANGQRVADYVQEGRDYKLEAKPGYVKFTYPHPLRNSSSQPLPAGSGMPSATSEAPHKHYSNKKRPKKTGRGKWPSKKKNSENEKAE